MNKKYRDNRLRIDKDELLLGSPNYGSGLHPVVHFSGMSAILISRFAGERQRNSLGISRNFFHFDQIYQDISNLFQKFTCNYCLLIYFLMLGDCTMQRRKFHWRSPRQRPWIAGNLGGGVIQTQLNRMTNHTRFKFLCRSR